MAEVLWVDPAELFLPSGRAQGADSAKLSRQISKYGRSLAGMPPLLVTHVKDGKLQISDGVTRAVRAAKFRPGELIPVEIMDNRPKYDVSGLPRVKERLP